MWKAVKPWLRDFVALFLPRRCSACDMGLMPFEESLCLACLEDLPRTRFHHDRSNPVERLFWGKLQLTSASAFLFFRRQGMVQQVLHRLKYKNDRAVGLELGKLMAIDLMACERFNTAEVALPVPLHRGKERQRGYNQSRVLIEGMQREWEITAPHGLLVRAKATNSQTRKGRWERWTNVKEAFIVTDPEALRDKHVLLVDDVVTTGATLEGCVHALSEVPGIRISIFTAACA